MSGEIFFDGTKYVSADDAAFTGELTTAYIARLCREGKLVARRVGSHWYISQESFATFLAAQAFARGLRMRSFPDEIFFDGIRHPDPSI